jgi:hypothetical protein
VAPSSPRRGTTGATATVLKPAGVEQKPFDPKVGGMRCVCVGEDTLRHSHFYTAQSPQSAHSRAAAVSPPATTTEAATRPGRHARIHLLLSASHKQRAPETVMTRQKQSPRARGLADVPR